MEKLQKNIFRTAVSFESNCDMSENPKKLEAYRRHLNEKLFSVSSIGLSYRQINTLENNDIFRSGRKDKKGWRAFSYKERIFLLVVKELRNYGFKDKQLKNLRDAFFKKCYELNSDMAIAGALEENKVMLLINSKGEVSFQGPLYLEENYTSFININLNEIIEGIRQELGAKRLDYITSADILAAMIPSEKERKVIKAVRNGNYKSVSIEFSDGIGTEKIRKIKAATHRKVEKGESLNELAKKPNRKTTFFSNNNGDLAVKIEEELK